MSGWPLWRLLVWIETWLLGVTAFHHYRPIHGEFVVPLLIAVIPGGVLVVIRSLARAATEQTATDERPANLLELAIGVTAVAAAAWWTLQQTLVARDDLRGIDAMLGQATIIVDVSLTGLSMVACFAALTLDWFVATAHEQLRGTMQWLRRTHILVTICHVAALIGSAWAFTNWPETTEGDAALFQRARMTLHVHEYAKATILPVQACFAALAVIVVALDSRTK
jgi:hypothetical protein